ncbi:TraB/GumN family protein [Chryseolinea sp. T2]|uniref:TraB/GumN family protein n=1 Tax=Chryseolinea sp. T2 TaxID=3129255 RepID=UPI0030770FB6
MGKRKYLSYVAAILLCIPTVVPAQELVENALFWKIQRKDLPAPSYLFGTFHLMSAHFVDSLSGVINGFHQCHAVVGEILLDSTITTKLMLAARLEGTTLDKLLSPEDYKAIDIWFKELSGMELERFNSMNPATIQNLMMVMLQQKYYPSSEGGSEPMDLYFQRLAKSQGKQLKGLENLDVQINALFKQFPIERQAEMLADFVRNKDRALAELKQMNASYRSGDLRKLESLLAEQNYTKSESAILLDDRNMQWMESLPGMLRQQPTFVAVGALHLAGEKGLVSLLRKAGYTVTSIPTNP